MRPFNFNKPVTREKALGKKTSDQFIAGGTNLLDLMKKNISQPEALFDITTVLSNKIEIIPKAIRIGAMVRNSAIALDKNILSKYPLIAKAVLAGASPQIRNMASTGGNLLQRTRCPYFYDITTPCNKRNPGTGCSALQGDNRMSAIIGYSDQCVAVHPSDLCVALAALDAIVVIYEKNGNTMRMPFKYFHRLPEEKPEIDNHLPANGLIAYIEIHENSFNKNHSYLKLRDRDSYAFALVSVAAALQIQNNKITDARLASGGVAHKPWRWYEAEEYLKGKEPNAEHFSFAAEMALKDVKPLQNNGFKVMMLKGAIETALQNCLTTQ